MKKVFLSYREADEEDRNKLYSIMRNTNNTLNYIPVTDRVNLRNEPPDKREEKIRAYLRPKIGDCNILALLLGDTTHGGPVVHYECEVALSKDKPIFAIRIPETTGGLPKILKNREIEIVEWEINEIQSAIDRMT